VDHAEPGVEARDIGWELGVARIEKGKALLDAELSEKGVAFRRVV